MKFEEWLEQELADVDITPQRIVVLESNAKILGILKDEHTKRLSVFLKKLASMYQKFHKILVLQYGKIEKIPEIEMQKLRNFLDTYSAVHKILFHELKKRFGVSGAQVLPNFQVVIYTNETNPYFVK